MKLLVKNMVCHRCVLAVKDILEQLSVHASNVSFGEIELDEEISAVKKQDLSTKLEKIGFQLIDNHTGALIEKVRLLVMKRARNEDDGEAHNQKLSVDLSKNTNHEYTYLSSLFSSVEGKTIEKYFIEQRIEKAKELLIYGQMTLSEIANELEYSSVAHLSAQFKKITGLTPSHFKQIGASKRKSLDSI